MTGRLISVIVVGLVLVTQSSGADLLERVAARHNASHARCHEPSCCHPICGAPCCCPPPCCCAPHCCWAPPCPCGCCIKVYNVPLKCECHKIHWPQACCHPKHCHRVCWFAGFKKLFCCWGTWKQGTCHCQTPCGPGTGHPAPLP